MSFLSLSVIFASPWKLRKAAVYDEVKLFPNVSLAQLAGRTCKTVFKCMAGAGANICPADCPFCSHFWLVWTSVWDYFPMEMWSSSIDHLNWTASGPSASSSLSSGTSPVKGTHLFNHLNHWTGLSKYRIQKAGLRTSCANVLNWTNRM